MRHRVRLSVVAWAVVLGTLCGCAATSERTTVVDVQLATLDELVDGTYELHVDREWAPAGDEPATPQVELAEADYLPVDSGTVYEVVVSENTRRVAIGDEPLVGMVDTEAPTRVEYPLDAGTFAGGRFVLRQTASGVDGELTIFGSGRPIVKSERGPLLRP